MKNLISCILIGMALLLLPLSAAGDKSETVSPFFHTLSTEDGLPSNSVLSIFKDHRGFLWFGTEKGLARFDGNDIKNYLVTSNDEIWAIEEQDDDCLLFGTVSQLKSFNRRTNELTVIDFPVAYVRAIKKAAEDCFIIGTDTGLFMLTDGKLDRIHVETGLTAANDITGIERQDSLNFWCSTADGIVLLNIKDRKPLTFRMPLKLEKSNHFTCLAKDGDTLYLGSFNKGLFKFDIPTRTFAEIEGFRHTLIQSIQSDGTRLFIGTNGRGLRTVSKDGRHFGSILADPHKNGTLKSNTITAFLYDEGLHWVATQFGGVNYTPRSKDKFTVFRFGDFNTADHRVASFYIYPDKSKLIGTREGLYFVDEAAGIVKKYSINEGNRELRSDIITYIGKIGDEVLVGTYGGGIHRFNRQTLAVEDISDEDLFKYGCVFQFIPDRDDNMWVATQEGLYHATRKGQVHKHFTHENSPLPTSIVRRVCLDSKNRLWIGTKFGLAMLDPHTDRITVDNIDIPKRDHIQYLYHDKRGNTFICGSTSLSVVDSNLKVIKHFDGDSWLDRNRPTSIKEVGEGMYWVATDREIVKYSLKDTVLQKFQRQDGLPSMSFNSNSLITKDGMIFFTNEGGLVYASTIGFDNLYKGDKAPAIVSCVTDGVETDILETDYEKGFSIPADASDVTFKVSSMDFTLPYTNSYEYMLEGYDKSWQKLRGTNRIVYRDLPAGSYNLLVRKTYSGQTSTMKVTVERSYMKIAGIVAASLVIVVLFAFFIYKIWKLQTRIRRERKLFTSVSEVKENSKKTLPGNPGHEELMDKLLVYMDEKKPYTNVKLSIKEVAKDLETTDVELSRLLNARMSVNWATFVNTYRVNEVKRRIKDGQLSRLTLKALSEKCGFGSKTTFYRVFKGIVGMTPLEYCQSKGISVSDPE